jgi:alkanesulfonate monooxygenase SsuD/methylene tetrahydromethanopterin reductase-like flavin-dependent oxidoreductase (luciferase family)
LGSTGVESSSSSPAPTAIELGTPGQRSDRFEEACEVLTGLLSLQQTTAFKGSYYELTGARCNPKPLQTAVVNVDLDGEPPTGDHTFVG